MTDIVLDGATGHTRSITQGSTLYSENIEIARGIAAFSVMVFHSYIWYLNPTAMQLFQTANFSEYLSQGSLTAFFGLLLGFGFLGVNLFFVVSGYCIHLGNASKGVRALNTRVFLAKRIMRIYPLYLTVVLFLFLYWGAFRGEWLENNINAQNLIGHLVFWHYFGAENTAGMGISIVMWTIAIEVQFYIFYALLYPLLIRIGFGRSAMIFLTLEIGYRVWFHAFAPSDTPLFFNPSRLSIMRFGEWILGAWLAEMHVAGRLSNFGTKTLSLGIVLIVAGGVVGYSLGFGVYEAFDIPAAFGFFLILGSIVDRPAATAASSSAARAFRTVGRWLGVRCYSIYLVHASVLYIASGYIHNYITSHTLPKTLLCMAAALLVADVAYKLVESPSHKFSRKIGTTPAP